MYKELDYSRYYNQWHSDTPEHLDNMKSYYKRLLGDVLPSDRKSRILDIGCGQGFALITLKDIGYPRVSGIEVDRQQVRSCQQKNLEVKHIENTEEFLQQHPQTYDSILLLDVLEHIPHEKQLNFMKEILKALKLEGQLICTVPNANSILASRWLYNDWTHHLSFTEYSLDFLLFNAGFTEIQTNTCEFFEPPPFRLLLSRAILRKWYWKTLLHYAIFRYVRFNRRLSAIGELGWEQGLDIPLSLNLLVTAKKVNNDSGQ